VVKPVNQLSLLPPATQTGANTFGCLVNGQAFVPKNQSILEGPKLQCNYIYIGGGYYFTVGGSNKNSDGTINDIILFTDSLAISGSETIPLRQNINGDAAGEYLIGNAPYYNYSYFTNGALIGKLNITRFDSIKQIVSGTFYFNVLDHSGDTVKITDGRFDMPYTR
jgi:hypothetical protein